MKGKRTRVPVLPRLALIALVAMGQSGRLVGPEEQPVHMCPRQRYYDVAIFLCGQIQVNEPVTILGAERRLDEGDGFFVFCRGHSSQPVFARLISRSRAANNSTSKLCAIARASSGGTAFPAWR